MLDKISVLFDLQTAFKRDAEVRLQMAGAGRGMGG